MPKLGFSSLAHKFHEDHHHSSGNENLHTQNHVSTRSLPSFHSQPHIVNEPASHQNISSSPMGHASSSRRSFFGLNLGKSASNESQQSIMSDDNHGVHPHHSNSSHHHPNISSPNINGVSSPPPIQRNGSSSMVQLKKFFRPARKNSGDHMNSPTSSSSQGNPKRPTNLHSSTSNLKSVSSSSPFSSNSNNTHNNHNATHPNTPSTPTFTHDANNNMIVKTDQKFWDDLEGSVTKKYGKLGKVLGAGAGGSVRLIVRESDGVTFAVKEFVARRPNESIKEYAKKCTAEFCIGSTLHHPNIIQTLDIINENNHFFEVMEYAPIDFFAVVMSGQMTRSEINCCFKQITLGVSYLHSVGLAHRDLKLDNCVVTKDGIVKLIDFGSAVVFKYPFEDDIVLAHGIVGSDPYLAPEVLTSTENYDPQFVDIWSIAIIYCCMTLRRFPWKAPKQDDPSFSLYCKEDDQPHDYVESAKKHRELLIERKKKILQLQKEKEQEEQNTQNIQDKEMSAPAIKTEAVIGEVTKDINSITIDNKKPDGEINTDKVCADSENNQTEVDNKPTTDTNNASLKDEKRDMLLDVKLLGDPNKMAVSPKTDVAPLPSSASTPAVVNDKLPDAEKEHHHHHHHHHNNNNHSNSSPTDGNGSKTNAEVPERRTNAPTKSQKQIRGPYRLMRLLPHASRPIISKMLSVDLASRATMKEILMDEWFNEIKFCTVDSDGKTINDPGHVHTVV